MKTIQLTQNQVAKISDEDFDLISKYKWSAYRIAGTSANGNQHLYGFKAGFKKSIDGKVKKFWMHNIIMNPPSGYEVDHIDGDPLNNTRENLRVCTHAENCRNRGKPSTGKTSKYTGVRKRFDRNKFEASIRVNGKSIHIGYFESEEDAAKAYDAKATEEFGVFARLNFKSMGV